MIAPTEQATLAKELIETTCERQSIARDQLIIHSDRGPSMTSKTVAHLLADLGVEKSHSRPYVSNDNPYSEAQFKTMKYRGDYPNRFGSIEDARQWARSFFRWYNDEHYHSGLGLLTPEMVHYGQAERVRRQREQVLSAAYAQHPERFVRGLPRVPEVPDAVWINAPKSEQEQEKNKDETLVVVAGVDPVVRPEHSEGLSTNSQPVTPAQGAVQDLVLLH